VTRPVVTLGEVEAPRLEDVQHRRRQLFALLLLVFILVAGGLVLLAEASDLLGRPLPFVNADILRIGFVLLAVAFALYVREKERTLNRVERALIEERVLSTALESRVRELTTILRAGRAVASTLSLQDVLQLILLSAKELLGATEGSVMLFDEEKKKLRISASVGLAPEAESREIPVGEGVAGWVAEFREAVVLRGDVTDPRFRRFVPKDRKVRSAMSAPLWARAEPVGVLNVSVSEGEREYTEHDLRALTVFAEHAAIAINNARLYQREREASSRLADLDVRRREFLAVVSHDLKAPLTSILGYSRLLRDLGHRATDEQTREFTEIIDKQARRMLQMIEQLLMATSVEQGAPVLAREPLDLERIVREEVAAFGGVLAGRPVTVHVSEELPIVYGDRSAVEHILANLLDNAAKYSEDGSPIDIGIESADEEVRIGVADRGPGIPEEHLSGVFDRYQRGSPGGSGVGLGLFIVRSLAQGHGGRVWAENRRGGGAEVFFTLPLRREGSRVPDPTGG
jgi:two-component system, OmpR family, sensor histidine kinase KdpD